MQQFLKNRLVKTAVLLLLVFAAAEISAQQPISLIASTSPAIADEISEFGEKMTIEEYMAKQKSKSQIDFTASGPVSLQNAQIFDVLRLALLRNRDIIGATRRVEGASAQVMQARSIFGAKLTGNFQHVRVDDVAKTISGGRSIDLGKKDSQQAYFEVTQPVFLSGRDRAALSSARLGRNAAQAGHTLTQQQVLLETTMLWLAWLFSSEAEKVGEKDLELAQAHYDLVSMRYKHKQVSQFELLRADVRLAQSNSDLRKKINDRELACLDLLNILDLPQDTPLSTQDRLQMIDFPIDLAGDSAKALDLREDVRLKRLDVRIAKQAIKSARSDNMPVISLFGQSGVQDPSSKSSMGQYERKGYWKAGVVANFTLADGGMRKGKIKEARAKLALAENSLKDTIKRANIEIKQAYLTIETAKEVVSAQHKALKQAEEALRLAGVRYSNGLFTQVELFDAENAYLATRLQYLQAILIYHQAYASYRLATGQLGRRLIASVSEY
jgi:outer membrane protein TolC